MESQLTLCDEIEPKEAELALTKTDNIAGEYVTEDLIGKPVRERTMRVSENAMQQLAQMFTDLYSNPIEAMVRETVSNATDATIKARSLGQDAPDVEIIRPAMTEQTLTVIDHGVGMTQHELDVYFSDYGNSTKIDDMSAIGSKGLGAKAMLAYSPSAKVITVKDGVEIIMTMTRGEKSNFTSIESVTKTDKHNGTTIIIPVRANDIDAVNDAIDRYARYAPAEAPITIDGEKRSLAQRYVKVTDIKIGEDVDPITGEVKPVMGALWAKKNSKGYDHVESYVESISDTVLDWDRKLDDIMSERDLKAAVQSADAYVRDRVCVTLSGWNYTLRPSTDRSSNRYSPYSDRGSVNSDSSYYRYVVEIKPGVVNFPAHRDNIINDHRLNLLVDRIANGLRLRKTLVDKGDKGEVWSSHKNDAVNAVRLWKDVPEGMRRSVAWSLFNDVFTSSWRSKEKISPWTTLSDVWPGVFDEYQEDLHEDDPSFYAVVAYDTTHNTWYKSKIFNGQYVSVAHYVTHKADPTNASGKTYRYYKMEDVENKCVVPFLSLSADYVNGSSDYSYDLPTMIPRVAKDQLVMTSDRYYDRHDLNRGPWNIIAGDLNAWDYSKIRSIPVNTVINGSSASSDVPYGVMPNASKYYMTIVQGDLGDWRDVKSKMGLLRRISRVRYEQGKAGLHVFYLVDGELDAETLKKATDYFKSFVSENDPEGNAFWMGVTTYDEVKSEAGKYDAVKRNPSKNSKSSGSVTITNTAPAIKFSLDDDLWSVAMQIALRTNRSQVVSDGTTVKASDLIASGDPVILYDASSSSNAVLGHDVMLDVFKTVIRDLSKLDAKNCWLICTTDATASFMRELENHQNVWIIDSCRASFLNLKAVKSSDVFHFVNDAKDHAWTSQSSVDNAMLQFVYDTVTPDEAVDVFRTMFVRLNPKFANLLSICVDDKEDKDLLFPCVVDDMNQKGIALKDLMSFMSMGGMSTWTRICEWADSRTKRDEIESPEFLRLMDSWTRILRYCVAASNHRYGWQPGVDNAEYVMFYDSFMNSRPLDLMLYDPDEIGKEHGKMDEAQVAGVHDGIIGVALRAWWDSLKK